MPASHSLPPPSGPLSAIGRMRLVSLRRIRYQLHNCPVWDPSRIPAVGAPGNCSIAVAWAFGVHFRSSDPVHVLFNGGWLNSSNVVHDIGTPGGLFDAVSRPAPGDVGAFGWDGTSVGHVWLVSRVDPASGAVVEVVDCSPSNGRLDSVRFHPPSRRLLSAGVRYGRFRFQRPGGPVR